VRRRYEERGVDHARRGRDLSLVKTTPHGNSGPCASIGSEAPVTKLGGLARKARGD